MILSYLIAIFPITLIILKLARNYPQFASKIAIISVVIFVVSCLFLSAIAQEYSWHLINFTQRLEIAFSLNHFSLIFLLFSAVLWVCLTIYINKYFLFTATKKLAQLQFHSLLILQFIILIFLSKNLFSLFIFYQILLFYFYFFNKNFTHHQDKNIIYHISILSLSASLALFLLMILLYKISATGEFDGNPIANLSALNFWLILILSLISLAPLAFVPFYLHYDRLYYLSAPIMILIFVITYGLVNLFILLKIIFYILGAKIFAFYLQQSNLTYLLNLILAANLLVCGFIATINSNPRKIAIYLFFNQLILNIWSIFLLKNQLPLAIIGTVSLILNFTLLFFTLSNLNLYLLNSREENFYGILYKLKINGWALVFSLLSIIGLMPTISANSKYFILDEIIKAKSYFFVIVIFGNIILNFIAIGRIIIPMTKIIVGSKKSNQEIANKIDSDFSFLLTISLLILLMVGGFFFMPLIENLIIKI